MLNFTYLYVKFQWSAYYIIFHEVRHCNLHVIPNVELHIQKFHKLRYLIFRIIYILLFKQATDTNNNTGK